VEAVEQRRPPVGDDDVGNGCEPGEAFAKLVDESQRRNIKVRDVAVELLDRMKTTS